MSRFAGVLFFDKRRGTEEARRSLQVCAEALDVARMRLQDLGGLVMASLEGDGDARGGCQFDGYLSGAGPLRGAELAKADYEREGASGLAGLIGGWSAAIWAEAAHAIVLASDYSGNRPLYYCVKPDGVYWSSSLRLLAKWTGAELLDQAYAADFLTTGSVRLHTPYKGIRSVMPGCAVRFEAGTERTERFWSLPLTGETRFRDPRDYEVRLRALLEDAVRPHLEDGTPVCAELSGGLDSSSVVCLMDKLRKGASESAVHTLSYFQEQSNDHPFIDEVEKHCGSTPHHLRIEAGWFAAPGYLGQGAPQWWGRRLECVRGAMREAGAGVLFTGQGGDLVMANWQDGSEPIGAALCAGHLPNAIRGAFDWGIARRRPAAVTLWLAARNAILGRWVEPDDLTFLPKAAREQARETSVSPGLERVQAEQARERFRTAGWRTADPGRRQRLRALQNLIEGRQFQCPEPLEDLAVVHPYAHRPLVEFMMTIPPEVAYGPGEPRRLMRRAVAPFVPAAVVKRRSKASYRASFFQSLGAMANAVLASGDLLLADWGVVDGQSAMSRLRRYVHHLDCNEPQLRHLLLLEYWLRERTGQSAAGQVLAAGG